MTDLPLVPAIVVVHWVQAPQISAVWILLAANRRRRRRRRRGADDATVVVALVRVAVWTSLARCGSASPRLSIRTLRALCLILCVRWGCRHGAEEACPAFDLANGFEARHDGPGRVTIEPHLGTRYVTFRVTTSWF